MSENNDLNKFAEQLMKERDFSEVIEVDVLAQIKEDLVESINENINAMIIAEMPPEKLEEFDQLIDEENDEKISNFIAENIPDLQEKLTQSLIQFRNSYLGI